MKSAEYDLYQSHVQKLTDFCKASELDFVLNCGRYPITMTVRPGEYYHQMSLLEAETPERNRADAAMVFTLAEGEIRFTAVGGFVISDATFSKLKGLFDKISRYWTQFVFRTFALAEDKSMFAELWSDAQTRTESASA